MRRIAIVALALGLAACSNDSTSPSSGIPGTYQLRTINGSSLPYTYSNGGGTVVSDVLTMFNDGTYSDVAQFGDGTVSSEQGIWSSTNGSITFDDQTDALEYEGSLSGSVLTEIFEGGPTDVYQRQ